MLIALIALQFTSCDNEPLTGNFVADDGINTAADGEFRASVDGTEFIADAVTAVLSTSNLLAITGVKAGTGESISLAVENAAVGTFSIDAGGGNQNNGIYFDASGSLPNPYIAIGISGGAGQVTITEIDATAQTMTGTFSFNAFRIAIDADGNPVLDGSGNPVLESVSVTAGAFNGIEYTVDDSGGGGGGGTVDDEFFARVDGAELVEETITVTQNTISEVPIVTIIAENAIGETIRLDIPEILGTGTFSMESISDGTKLIGVYQNGTTGPSLTSNPGLITITEFDSDAGRLSGTFMFTGTDPLLLDPTVVEITAGSFSVSYDPTIDNSIPPLRADIDGVEYLPETVNVVQSTFVGVPIITIATELGSETLVLTFPADIVVGSYDMSPNLTTGNEKVGTYTPLVGSSASFTSNPGTLTITSYDPDLGTIEGEFVFTGVDITGVDPTVYEIANGTFSVTF